MTTKVRKAGAGITRVADSLRLAAGSMSADVQDQVAEVRRVPLHRISPDPTQPRKVFDRDQLEALKSTIAAVGLLQPPVVKPDPEKPAHWLIVAGERRYRSVVELGWTEIDVVCASSDSPALALIENLQRVDLNPVEESEGIRDILEVHGMQQQELAKAIGRSPAEISRALGLGRLHPRIKNDVASTPSVSKGVLIELSTLDSETQLKLWLGASDAKPLTITAIRALKAKGVDGDGEGEGEEPVETAEPGGAKPLRARGWKSMEDRVVAHRAAGRPLTQQERAAAQRLYEALRSLLEEQPGEGQ